MDALVIRSSELADEFLIRIVRDSPLHDDPGNVRRPGRGRR
jgi:hypothetical protein